MNPVISPQGIGASIPRVGARRLVEGRARYTDDVQLPRMLHACFLRSPYAHARIQSMRCDDARAAPGVVLVATWQDIEPFCTPFVGVLNHMPGMVSAPQWPLAHQVARWQGEPIAMVVAETREQAEDAAQLIDVDWAPLAPVVDPVAALTDAPPIHPELPRGNLTFHAAMEQGDVTGIFEQASHRVDLDIRTTRVTAVTLEARGIVADWDPGRQALTVQMGTQVPAMMQSLLARHLKLAESAVRVVTLDTGGSFGLKIHAYPDEFSAVIASMILGRPVKFVADRLESFSSDVHAREHNARVSMAVDADGLITAFDVRNTMGIGAFSITPRGSINEVRHIVNLVGAPYRYRAIRSDVRVAFQNKAPYGQYRGVGHPIACLFTELAVECAARQIGVDPVAFRLRNFRSDGAYPDQLPTGTRMEALSHEACLHELTRLMDYEALRADQRERRAAGRHVGIGFATFVENSNHGSATYGKGGAPIAANDGCTIKLLMDGSAVCSVSATDSGQGTETAFAQIVSDALDIPLSRLRMQLGDTASAPHGGGNWGSRGTGIAGEAVLQTAMALRQSICQAASMLWDVPLEDIALRQGVLVAADGRSLGTLQELATAVYVRPDRFGTADIPDLTVTRHYAQRAFDGGIYTNGVQASYVEVDLGTGEVRLLRHWVVDDCGVVINPLLADEQIRGAVVQGLGQALLEGCLYDDGGQLMNATLAEYLVPMAGEMPDIEVGHVCTRTATSALGAKGVGEAGLTGAIAAVLNAINDALSPLGAQVTEIPVTPNVLLKAVGAIDE